MTKLVKRLYRSRDSKMVAGVCGGIAEYYKTDPTLIRLAYLAVTIVTGVMPGVLAYGIAVLVIPVQPTGPLAKEIVPDPAT